MKRKTEDITHQINYLLYNLHSESCVYIMTFKDGSFYIGHTSNLKSRIKHHIETMCGNNCDNVNVRWAFKKNGLPNVITIQKDTKQNCKQTELQLLKLSQHNALCLNIQKGIYNT